MSGQHPWRVRLIPACLLVLGSASGRFFLAALLVTVPITISFPLASWNGVLRDGAGKPVRDARVNLHAIAQSGDYTAPTSTGGQFMCAALAPGGYELTVSVAGKTWRQIQFSLKLIY